MISLLIKHINNEMERTVKENNVTMNFHVPVKSTTENPISNAAQNNEILRNSEISGSNIVTEHVQILCDEKQPAKMHVRERKRNEATSRKVIHLQPHIITDSEMDNRRKSEEMNTNCYSVETESISDSKSSDEKYQKLSSGTDTYVKISGSSSIECSNLTSKDCIRMNPVYLQDTKEKEVSTKFTNIDDECERLDALVCSEDPNSALKNFSARSLTHSKAAEFASEDLEYPGTSASLHEAKETELSSICMNVDVKPERLDVATGFESPNTAFENCFSGSSLTPPIAVPYSSNDSKYCLSDSMISNRNKESNSIEQSSCAQEIILNMIDSKIKASYNEAICHKENVPPYSLNQNDFSRQFDSDDVLGEVTNYCLDMDSLRSKYKLSNEAATKRFLGPRMQSMLARKLDNLGPLVGCKNQENSSQNHISESHPIPCETSTFSDRDSKAYLSGLKFTDNDQQRSIALNNINLRVLDILDQMKRKDEISMKCEDILARFSELDNNRQVSTDCSKDTDTNTDPDTDTDFLEDVFKTIIICHPIEKFEIPPYTSANAEGKLRNLDDPFTKDMCNSIQINSTDRHRNISERFTDTDSNGFMILDIADSFRQNSSIICEALMKEYLNISSKVDLLLVKPMRGTSTEGYELRIRSLNALDDELGYVSAKLITTLNDWNKQFDEIKKNIPESHSVSCSLHHMSVLRICIQFVSILIKSTFDKQLELENYENVLMYHLNERK